MTKHKQTLEWLEKVADYLGEECDKKGVGFVFMPFAVVGKTGSDAPSGLVCSLPTDHTDAAAAAMLSRLYEMSELKDKMNFKKWVKLLVKTTEKVEESKNGWRVVEKTVDRKA